MNRRFLVLIAVFFVIVFPAFAASPIKLIDYNIADGMWYDQFNHYDRFVSWVKGQDPDILAICEGATHWDKEGDETPRTFPRYLPDSLAALAARWGHPYVAVGPYQDNYPVAFTSKFPIEVIERVGGPNVSHGALYVKIRGVNYIVLHLWPLGFAKGDENKVEGGGNVFRTQEVNFIMDQTIRNPKYAKEKRWVIMGDFNSLSIVDSAEYRSFENSYFGTQDAVRAVFPCDAVAYKHRNAFCPSMVRVKKRLDYVYCSKKMSRRLVSAEVLKDAFSDVASDHRPIIVVFK
jgi:exodeoxyribonuclease-3